MNSNAKEPGMTKKRIYSIVEDGPVGAINAPKRKRAGLPFVLVTVFSVLCVLVSPLARTVWPISLAVPGSVANTFRNSETIGKPTVVTAELTGNGRTNDVLWDKYSLVLKGQRIFIQYVRP